MIKDFGKTILASQKNAVMWVLLFSILPFFQWISCVIMMLVTLRKGPKEGLILLVPASLVYILFGINGSSEVIWFGVFGGTLYLWLMACILWRYASWRMVLQASIVLAVITIFIVHGVMPDLNQWWIVKFRDMLVLFDTAMQQGTILLDHEQLQDWQTFVTLTKETDILQQLAYVALGCVLVMNIIIKLILLALARWWQAQLYNPQGLRLELQDIRLSAFVPLIFIASLLTGYLGLNVFLDIVPIFTGMMLLAGLSVVHFVANGSRTNWQSWLIVIFTYGLLLLLPRVLLLMIVAVAMADSVFNLRCLGRR